MTKAEEVFGISVTEPPLTLTLLDGTKIYVAKIKPGRSQAARPGRGTLPSLGSFAFTTPILCCGNIAQ